MRFLLTLSCHLQVCTYSHCFHLCVSNHQTLHKKYEHTSPLNYLFCIPCHCLVWGQNLMVLSIYASPDTASEFTLHSIFYKTIIYHLRTKFGCPTRRKRTILLLFILRTKQNELLFLLFWDWLPSYICRFLIRWIRNSNF